MAEIHSLKPQNGSIRREQFITQIAQAFDKYVDDNGYEPDAIVHVLTGVTQETMTGFMMAGASENSGLTCLALANMGILHVSFGFSRQIS
jgi:chorismate mutase